MARAASATAAGRQAKWKCQAAFETELRARGFRHIAGADEVGRGCLFGPVVAAAVILSPDHPIRGLNDSKQIEPERREVLAERIRERALSWAVTEVDSETIDRINILQASRLAMKRAVEQLNPQPDYVLVDAVALDLALPQQPIIQGDARCHAVAAASIIAKVHRDRLLAELDSMYPGYGLANHKGYHTAEHLAALEKLGPTPLHRFTFEPIRSMTRMTPLSREPQLEMFATAQ